MAIYADKKNGKPTGRWRVEVQKDGGRARGRFDTLQEAKRAEAQWLLQMPEKTVVREDKRGVPKTLQDLWDKNGGELWRGMADRDTSRRRLEKALVILGAKTRLEELTTDKIDTLVARLFDDDLEGSTINKYLSALHKLLEWGRERRWVTDIPAFPWQEDNEGRIRWLSVAEEEGLNRLLEDRVAAVVRVAIATGMRRGEILGLTKKNLQSSKVYIWNTKNKLPRIIPISSDTHDTIAWLLDVGLPTIHQLRYEWSKARISLGLVGDEWFTFHVCRHTFATRLVEANVSLRIIQKLLGHKSIKTTERYAQVTDHALSAAISHLEVFRAGHLASPPPMGYASPTAALGLPVYNPQSVKVNFRYGPFEGSVRGRGEIGRHAGFRFQWGNEQDQEDQK